MKNIAVVASLVFLFACGGGGKDEKGTPVKVGDRFSVDIPSMLTSTDQLNPAAVLQYMNAAEELYLMVMEESQEEFYKSLGDGQLDGVYSKDFEGYTKILVENYYQTMSVDKRTKPTDKKINGLPAKVVDLEAHVKGIDIFYSIAFVQGKTNFYQVMTWTLQSRKDTHKGAMANMINSFKEIGK